MGGRPVAWVPWLRRPRRPGGAGVRILTVRILVTGGCGFIGANLIRRILTSTEHEVVNLDALTYAGNPENLRDVEGDFPLRYRFVHGDICDAEVVRGAMAGADAVVNLAAETHVDRSIVSDAPFVRTNVLGTQTLLATALHLGVGRFVQVSTDEVYGHLPWRDPDAGAQEPGSARSARADHREDRFTERSPLAPRSPYAASKAAADLLGLSYHTTHGLDVVVTRCGNNYGPFQFPEKLIPLVTIRALELEGIPVYGDGLHVRDWIHVDDHCRGLLAVLERGREGTVYNLGAEGERTNLSVVRTILGHVGAPETLIRFVADRPGHDRRYAVDAGRARRELGWRARVDFDEGLRATVWWYRENRGWWEAVTSGTYRAWVAHQYGEGGTEDRR